MNDKYFLDTNIFVYCFDLNHPDKKARSLSLISEALRTGDGIISTQVIQEFLNVATRKFTPPLKNEDANIYLLKVLYPLCEVFPDLDLYQSALDIMRKTHYAFYDSLILAGASQANCSILYSEDLRDRDKVKQVSIINPYH